MGITSAVVSNASVAGDWRVFLVISHNPLHPNSDRAMVADSAHSDCHFRAQHALTDLSSESELLPGRYLRND